MVIVMETTITTDKNNFFYGGQHARRFKNAARFRGKKKMLFLHVVFVVFNRAGLKRKKVKGQGKCP